MPALGSSIPNLLQVEEQPGGFVKQETGQKVFKKFGFAC